MNGLSIPTWSWLGYRSDEDAMLRVKLHDDHQEFARLVRRWETPIRRLCARMLGDVERGEDLKQEAFLRLFAKRKDYQPTSRFSTYLWRIALNLCYDELRRRERRREFVRPGMDEQAGPEELIAESPGPYASVVAVEEGELVRRALLKLPEIYRAVLVLRHYHDMKLAQIAEVLGIPEGTVNSRMAEGLNRLSRLLEPQFKTRRESSAEGTAWPLPKESVVL
jgi:RNA polymerase sigma-70 factor (ECF subfamily)